MEIEDIFGSFSEANNFLRVDSNHPLELYVGLDDCGRKAIELRAPFTYRKVIGTSVITVTQYERKEYKTIRFSLVEKDVSGLFYTFCKDLIEQTRGIHDSSVGYTVIINRFFQWKKMFSAPKKPFLSEMAIMGLIGELLCLRGYLSEKIGISNALKAWSGQELTHKDFSFDDTWVEVKTISRGALGVKISSLEQLDGEHEGELLVYSLEKMSREFRGITLNKLVMEIRNSFDTSDDQELFMNKVMLQGYEYNDYYDDFVYMECAMSRFQVNEGFPRLKRKDIPIAIAKASYELVLAEIAGFECK